MKYVTQANLIIGRNPVMQAAIVQTDHYYSLSVKMLTPGNPHRHALFFSLDLLYNPLVKIHSSRLESPQAAPFMNLKKIKRRNPCC